MNPEEIRQWLQTAKDRLSAVHDSPVWQKIANHDAVSPDLTVNLADALTALEQIQTDYETALETLQAMENVQDTPENSLSASQILGNADRFGGWDNAVAITKAIEEGRHNDLRQMAEGMKPEDIELIERVITASMHHR